MERLAPAAPRLACRALSPERLFFPDVHLFDPSLGLDERGHLLVEDGRLSALGPDAVAPSGAEVVSALSGCHVFPGFVDCHTHLRTPGFEYKEDLVSGTRAAAAGGYVTVIAMANTSPVVDQGPLAAWVLDQAATQASVRVGQVGAVTRGLQGAELAEMRELIDAGVPAFSDDGRPLDDADVLLEALRYLRGTGRPILLHLEDRDLAVDGVMHEGRWSARLGLKGIPGASESGELARDLEVVRYAARAGEVVVHLQHLSAAASIRLLTEAKDEGLPVTAEVTPHHLLLTDEDVRSFDPNLRINPPLRSEADRQVLISALREGLVDCIGTDHAPHAPHEKEVPFEMAASGTVGLETAFAALYAGLVLSGELTLGRLIEALSAGPCRCLGLDAPQLRVGAPADCCLVDLEERWTVAPADLAGRSRNSAFLGRPVQGRVLMTLVDGTRRFQRERSGGGARV